MVGVTEGRVRGSGYLEMVRLIDVFFICYFFSSGFGSVFRDNSSCGDSFV